MFRQNRVFTVEFKGRRKVGSFDWASAVAATDLVEQPALPTDRTKQNSSRKCGANGSAAAASHPAGAAEGQARSPHDAGRACAPRPPEEQTRAVGDLTQMPLPGKTISPDAAETTSNDRPPTTGAVQTGLPDATADSASSIHQVTRTRRISAALSRAEKWKRRLPALLR